MNRALLELQEVDNSITNMTREKARLDDGTVARAARDALQKSVAETTAKSHKSAAGLADKEMELKTAEEKITRQQSRMMTASSAHEISALQRDIEALGRARGDLDEAILTYMDEGETLAVQLADLEAQLARAKAAVEVIESNFDKDTVRLEKSLSAARVERVEAAAKLSPVETEKFVNSAKKHAGVAVSKVVKGNCSACGAAIIPFTLREAKNQEFPTCEGCGRLIFVE